MIAFRSAVDAVACAVAMQTANEVLNGQAPASERLRLRIGMTSGEAIRDEGDYFGQSVRIAARLEGSGQPGQILVSSVVRGLIGTRVGYAFRDVGPLTLRGIREPVGAFEVLWQSTATQDVGQSNRPEAQVANDPARSSALAGLPQVMAAILFLDVVDSTALNEKFGDREFREKSRQLDGALREVIRRAGGTVLQGKVLGDGIMAIFSAARYAVECAIQFKSEAESVGLELHTGIHAGDVIREADNVYGGAVNIGARIQAASTAGQILVSDVVRGLARTSTTVEFTDLGEHELRGVADRVRLYQVRTTHTTD